MKHNTQGIQVYKMTVLQTKKLTADSKACSLFSMLYIDYVSAN